MISHTSLSNRSLVQAIRSGELALGGNRRLKIYGTLQCRSGKTMKRENRVFFRDEQEALEFGYRPCGHCMNAAYQQWKTAQ